MIDVCTTNVCSRLGRGQLLREELREYITSHAITRVDQNVHDKVHDLFYLSRQYLVSVVMAQGERKKYDNEKS